MEASVQLDQVLRSGAPEQVAHACRLLERLDQGLTPDLENEVALLYDAFLNDPYLTR